MCDVIRYTFLIAIDYKYLYTRIFKTIYTYMVGIVYHRCRLKESDLFKKELVCYTQEKLIVFDFEKLF